MGTNGRTLGELISEWFEKMMERFGDKELAAVATVAVINEALGIKPAEPVAGESAIDQASSTDEDSSLEDDYYA